MKFIYNPFIYNHNNNLSSFLSFGKCFFKKNWQFLINHWAGFFFFFFKFSKKCFLGYQLGYQYQNIWECQSGYRHFGLLDMHWSRVSNNQLITACYLAHYWLIIKGIFQLILFFLFLNFLYLCVKIDNLPGW